jgi:hypothetical protein
LKIFNTLRNILISDKFFTAFFGALGLLSLIIAYTSLRWTYGLDNQFHLYLAFLSDRFNFIPYRDFFANQFPCTFLYYFIIVKIFGHSYTGFRIADIIFLIIILSATFFLFKKISLKVAFSSLITFSLIYFVGGNYFSLQRDYVLLLPIILSILLFTSYPGRLINIKSFIIGFSCAISSLIKPHALIVYPVLIVFHLLYNSEEGSKIFSLKRIFRLLIYSLFGLSVPILATILFLWATNSLKSFWEIQMNFNTAYRNSKYGLVSEPSMSVNDNFITHYIKLGGYRPFLLPAALGLYIAIFRTNLNRHQKLLICLVSSLAFLFLAYISIAAKFFSYHWIPFAYCLLFLSSLCFVKLIKTENKYSAVYEIIPLIIIFSVITIQITRHESRIFFINELKGLTDNGPLYPGILQAANYLKLNLRPGDKVLPLDDVGIANHSMLLVEAEPGSYYPYEALFAFGETEFPNSEYFKRIHKDYMDKFKITKPRFIIDFSGAKHFDDLQQILETDYTSMNIVHGFIYTKKIPE